eukprot:TRINITY_DN51756_c0_g1_i1.p1 TRINITY_DN51756_c0_g1~~TRINITY_DN51756_c0_g1_i1.p1  ORF type:complete len:328 (-),score=42.12 TRINITY_DN51756_c0_g1_i1:413-1396(-)
MNQRALAALLVTLGAFGWSVRDLGNKYMKESGDDAPSVWTITAFQGAIGFILVFLVDQGKACMGKSDLSDTPETIDTKAKLWLVARVLGALAGIALHIMALSMVDLALASMIHCSAPLFIVLLSRVILKEPIKLAAAVAMGICCVGLVLDIAPWKSTKASSLLGILLVFGSAFGSAVTYTSLRALKDIKPSTSLKVLYLGVFIIGFLLALASGISKPTGKIWGFLFMVALSTFFSEWCITKGYALAIQGAGSVAVFKFLTPIFAIGWDASLFGHYPTALSLTGAALVLVSSAALVRIQASNHNTEGSQEADIESGDQKRQMSRANTV